MPIPFDGPGARLTSVMGLAVVKPLARLTSLSGTTRSGGRAHLTFLAGYNTPPPAARLTSLSVGYPVALGAPVIAPGPGQQVGCGERVTLTASALFASGASVQTWQWRLVSKSTGAGNPILSTTTGQSPTFYAPLIIPAATYTFGVSVTDNSNRTSDEGLVVVSVDPATTLAPGPAGWDTPVAMMLPTADGWV